MKTITIHSSKGGAGKTTVSVNLAASLAHKGYNVCLVDYDFASPNLQTYLGFNPIAYLNDVLYDDAAVETCVYKLESLSSDGGFYSCFSNPHSESIDQVLRLTEEQATKMLVNTFKLKEYLEKQLNINYLIIDTSPGIGLTVVNSFLAADSLLFVIRLSKVDIESTMNMLNGFKEHITNDTMLVINLVPTKQYNNLSHRKLEILTKESLKTNLTKQEIDLLGWLPTDNEFFEIEFEIASKSLAGENVNMPIMYYSFPESPFSKSIDEISKRFVG